MQLPVELLIHYVSGREETLFWDGKARTQTRSASRNERVGWAQLDPKHKLYMDVNVVNNSLTVSSSSAPAGKFAVKFLFWMETAAQWLGALV